MQICVPSKFRIRPFFQTALRRFFLGVYTYRYIHHLSGFTLIDGGKGISLARSASVKKSCRYRKATYRGEGYCIFLHIIHTCRQCRYRDKRSRPFGRTQAASVLRLSCILAANWDEQFEADHLRLNIDLILTSNRLLGHQRHQVPSDWKLLRGWLNLADFWVNCGCDLKITGIVTITYVDPLGRSVTLLFRKIVFAAKRPDLLLSDLDGIDWLTIE